VLRWRWRFAGAGPRPLRAAATASIFRTGFATGGCGTIEAVLIAFDGWMQGLGQCVVLLDDDSDTWLAAVGNAADRTAFIALREQLSLKVRPA
jgi:hypothetical protein